MAGTNMTPGGNPRRTGRPLSARERQIMRLIEQGIVTPVEIAERIGIARGHTRVILCKMRKKGLPVPNMRTGLPIYLEPITVVVTREIVDGVRAHAKRRGTTATDLIQKMIRVIATENLFDAIFDDDKA